MIRVKRIYDGPGPADGFRILVDRLWPRGMLNIKAGIDLWLKEIAPSNSLRKCFAHAPKRWASFKRRYHIELKAKGELIHMLRDLEKKKGTITLLYAATDKCRNNAVVLKKFLRQTARRD